MRVLRPIPGSAMLFASVDYGTLELVTLAQTCIWMVGESRMAEAINAGRDLHVQFGASIAGCSYDELKARIKAGDKGAKDFRQLSKPANFGLGGGLGAEKLVLFARQSYKAKLCELAGRAQVCGVLKIIGPRSGKPLCSVCFEVAKELRKLWFQEWPEVGRYHAIVQDLTGGDGGGAVQVPGPGTDWGIVRGGCHFCDGANNGFQEPAARGAKTALYHTARECYTDRSSPLWACRPAVFLHDEILLEAPMHKAPEAAERLSEVMVKAMKYYTPDINVKAEPALQTNWFKGAECVRDEKGRLLAVTQCPACTELVPMNWDFTLPPHDHKKVPCPQRQASASVLTRLRGYA